jgi:hypothetical protein
VQLFVDDLRVMEGEEPGKLIEEDGGVPCGS